MSDQSKAQAYWYKYVQQQADPAATQKRFFEIFSFGSTQEMADELAELVVQGVKTATSALPAEFGKKGIVQPGHLSVVTDAVGNPVCITETVEVRVIPFKEVDAQFAYDYGEEARTLEWWREAIGGYDRRQAAATGEEFNDDTLIVCERFKVVYK